MKIDDKKYFHQKNLFSIIVFFIISIGFVIIFITTSFTKTSPENNSVTPENAPDVLCPRTNPYEMTPEFERGISIIKQKMVPEDSFLNGFENCLNIQYEQLKENNDGPEGVFLFDDSISSPNNLRILVDESYKSEDDYMTAILLVHEITHAKQFYEKSLLSCTEKEVHAFWNEFLLITRLNDGEKNSIVSRLENEPEQLSISLQGVDTLIETVRIAYTKCEEDKSCTQDEAVKIIREQIKNSPYYKKQCGL